MGVDVLDALYISIHAPREGCDFIIPPASLECMVFQSTHPVRGATANLKTTQSSVTVISIHAPREGCDTHCGRLAHRY